MFIDVCFLNLVSPNMLSLFVVEAISSGLDVVCRVVLCAADPLPNPQYQPLNTPLDWVRLVGQQL